MRVHHFARLSAVGVVVIPAILLTVSASCSDQSDPTGPAAARAAHAADLTVSAVPTDAILEIVNAMNAAWVAKDAAGYAASVADDAQIITPVGGLLTGRAAFQAQHVFLFNGPLAGTSNVITVRDIEFLTGTIAIVYLDMLLSDFMAPPPGLPVRDGVVRNRATWVVQKRGGEWEIVMQQTTPQA